tara:strand:- start:1352 stop:1837 length:486 start_codon:yes stop_codon:yes gene_type:complete
VIADVQSFFSNKLDLIVKNLKFSKIIYVSEKYNDHILNSLTNNFDLLETKKCIGDIRDFARKEDLIILEINEQQFSQDILLDIAKLRTYHQTNLIILVKHQGNLQPNQFHETLMSYGFKNLFGEKLQNIFYDLYEYNIIDYKIKPEWLNSDYWANPELWKK